MPAILLQLFHEALFSRASPDLISESEKEAISKLIKTQVRTHRDPHEEPFDVMVAAQLLISAACCRALGKNGMTLMWLWAAHQGIQGGYLTPKLNYVQVRTPMKCLLFPATDAFSNLAVFIVNHP